jgi:hypothetical protein
LSAPLPDSSWDARLNSFPQASFFHTSAWLRVLQDTYRFRPCHVVTEGDNGGILPILEVDSWLTGKRGVSLPFTDDCVALAHSPTSLANLIGAAQQLARSRHWRYWDYRGGTSSWEGATPSVEYYQHTLSLTKDTGALLRNCESSTRTAIRKAEQAGLHLEISQTHAAVREFYELVGATRRRQGLPPQPVAFFDQIQKHILAPGLGSIVLARVNGRPAAGAMFFQYGETVIYKFGASDEAYQELRPNNLVMWRAIEHYAQAGFSVLNFGRTSLANAGLRRFKRAWGTQETTVNYIKWSPRAGFLGETDRASGWHTRIFRAMPAPLSRLVGKLAYRHVA